MAALFFDTSAIVRRYHRTEPGSARVRALCAHPDRDRLLISRLTPVEVASAVNRKLREGAIDGSQRDRQWQAFLEHGRRQYQAIDLDPLVYRRAQQLLFQHRLRAYDAVQVACALRAAQLLSVVAPDLRFCTADRAQAEAAQAEGLAVEVIA